MEYIAEIVYIITLLVAIIIVFYYATRCEHSYERIDDREITGVYKSGVSGIVGRVIVDQCKYCKKIIITKYTV